MPYTNQWPAPPESAPPDSELANLLAKNVRDLELNIRERMDDQFTDANGTWAASGPAAPIVPGPRITGKDVFRQRILHHSSFSVDASILLDASQNAWLINTLKSDLFTVVQGTNLFGPIGPAGAYPPSTVTLYAPVEFGQPVAGTAMTITSIDMYCDPLSKGAISLTFQKNTYGAAPATTVLGTATSTNTTGIANFTSGSFSYLVLQNEDYYLKIVMPFANNSTGRLYGVRLNLSSPSDARALLG